MTLLGPYDNHPIVPPLRFLGLGDTPEWTDLKPLPASAPMLRTPGSIVAGDGKSADDENGGDGNSDDEGTQGDDSDDAPDRARLFEVWQPVLARLSLPESVALQVAGRALATATAFPQELLASGAVAEADLYRAIAAEFGLRFVTSIDAGSLLVDPDLQLQSLRRRRGLGIALVRRPDGRVGHLIADPALDLVLLSDRLFRTPALRASLCVAPPSALRAAVIARMSAQLMFDAQHRLLLQAPEFCARTVVTASQGAAVIAAAFLCVLSLWLAPGVLWLALSLVGSAGFSLCVVLRLLAWGEARPPQVRRALPADPAEQPVYSVLVALYRESEVVPQLLAALARLQWPRSKLEIKLVCEADDDETLAALRRHRLRPEVELVLVPPGLPRTKPKALAYALPLCSGEFVTLYDAEDRPNPLQLLEAWQRFRDEPADLACLQAPLVVTNGRASSLSAMFSFEYAALFRGILPWLARHGLVLPLGGTSNHFRRAALDEVGGWDAYNVTEDAELGLRLARYGYRTGVIARPTFEEAPERLGVWLPQRVRWFKGWTQTWLVHMREPAALWSELGPASFLAMQVVSLGMIVSALFHPLFVASVFYGLGRLVLAGHLVPGEMFVTLLALANIVAGYGAFIALGLATLTTAEKPRPLLFVVLTPFHWLLLSVAAWVALWEIYRRPHHWSKTPHGRRARKPA
jgi:cellulose synthase/poly-beta-1,6-N-acetylglucosamine synthase-like glycosyltransferase